MRGLVLRRAEIAGLQRPLQVQEHTLDFHLSSGDPLRHPGDVLFLAAQRQFSGLHKDCQPSHLRGELNGRLSDGRVHHRQVQAQAGHSVRNGILRWPFLGLGISHYHTVIGELISPQVGLNHHLDDRPVHPLRLLVHLLRLCG